MQWIETLDLYGPTHAEGLSPDQSVELEKKMYDAAVLSVKEGYRKLAQLSVPASRRQDYYAEMLKTDSQMVKIRARVVEAQQRIEAVEVRKAKVANQKFAKQLKANKIAKKQESKKLDDKKFDSKRLGKHDTDAPVTPFQNQNGKGKGKGHGKGKPEWKGHGKGKGGKGGQKKSFKSVHKTSFKSSKGKSGKGRGRK